MVNFGKASRPSPLLASEMANLLTYFISFQELCIIRFAAATDEEKISYVSLYSYFHSRKRCGVIGNCHAGVKDMYLVPLASHEPVPSPLLPFNGPGNVRIFLHLFSKALSVRNCSFQVIH